MSIGPGHIRFMPCWPAVTGLPGYQKRWAKRGSRMQKYYRDLAMYKTHIAAQWDVPYASEFRSTSASRWSAEHRAGTGRQ